MTIRLERNDERGRDSEAGFDLQALLHPAGAFAHPRDVVADRDMTINEKRAILASWASDACAVESAPELRIAPSGKLVPFDEVMDALRALDQQAVAYGKPQPHYRRVLADRIPGVFRRKSRQAHGTGAPQA
jgi:hypothetical protein